MAPSLPHPDYLALTLKVDAFAAAVGARRDDLRCRMGCSSCCHVELALCDVEADALGEVLRTLDEGTRETLRSNLAARPAGEPDAPCPLLERTEGRCLAYEGRPLVCRTQGLPLRYPPAFVPLETVRARAPGGEIVWCPLNFDREAPAAADVLDAERVDAMLALVNQRATTAEDRLRRTAIRALIERAVSTADRDVR